MPLMHWRVALIDSGLEAPHLPEPVAVQGFASTAGRVRRVPAVGDTTGHGSALAEILHASGRAPQLLIAQVLNVAGRTTPAALADALQWTLAQGAQLVHLSLGLAQDRPVLRRAVAEVQHAGVLIVAATPARGRPSFPAAYPGVLRATGDARCGPEQIAALDTATADFGGCVAHHSAGRMLRGASIGAAHVSRYIVRHLPPSLDPAQLRTHLARTAAFTGPERRSGAAVHDSGEVSG